MSIKVGDRVYLIVHAYHHYIGEVVEILGVRRVALGNASKIHSCNRGWEEFFLEGIGDDTRYDYVGGMPDLAYMIAHEWNHDLPGAKKTRGKR